MLRKSSDVRNVQSTGTQLATQIVVYQLASNAISGNACHLQGSRKFKRKSGLVGCFRRTPPATTGRCT